jgi:hypothetical protein
VKKLLSIAAVMAVSLGGAVGRAAELPSYELMGIPIPPHQISVLGSAKVKEQLPGPSLTVVGMPASPHQVSVLTPRSRMTEELAAVRRRSFCSARSFSALYHGAFSILDRCSDAGIASLRTQMTLTRSMAHSLYPSDVSTCANARGKCVCSPTARGMLGRVVKWSDWRTAGPSSLIMPKDALRDLDRSV